MKFYGIITTMPYNSNSLNYAIKAPREPIHFVGFLVFMHFLRGFLSLGRPPLGDLIVMTFVQSVHKCVKLQLQVSTW